jgi:hypothetical protein
MDEHIEIDAEFTEPKPVRRPPHFDQILILLDTLEDYWRDSEINELAEAADQMSDTMRRWRMKNNQFVPKSKPDQCR